MPPAQSGPLAGDPTANSNDTKELPKRPLIQIHTFLSEILPASLVRASSPAEIASLDGNSVQRRSIFAANAKTFQCAGPFCVNNSRFPPSSRAMSERLSFAHDSDLALCKITSSETASEPDANVEIGEN